METNKKRFEIVAAAKELVLSEKAAIRIELQYGQAGKPGELVIADMYIKDGKWSYTRSQVRLECTEANAKYIIDAIGSMYKASTKLVKAETSKASDISAIVSKMSEAERQALLEALAPKAKRIAKEQEDDVIIELTNALTTKRGRKC